MTREEREDAIHIIDFMLTIGGSDGFDKDQREALKMGIEALKQEPCEDAVSRQAVYVIADTFTDGTVRICMRDSVSELPSVQPIRPKGEWEEYIDRNDYNDYESKSYVCSKCHHIQLAATNFCSNCGADMRKVEE